MIAVGGTTLYTDAGRGEVSESAWSETGSGCSPEPKPTWQSDVGCSGRTDNDVAAVADNNTPVSAYDSYESSGWQLDGGTSVSAPIIAAAMALATPYTRSFEGAQSLYIEHANGLSGIHDIASGSNGTCANYRYLCEAIVGYDGPTGLGSLRGAPEVPPPTPVTTGTGSIGSTGATLDGTINTHGGAVTGCAFEYGSTTTYGKSVACEKLPASGMSPAPVAAPVTGLTAGEEYHFRLHVAYQGGSGEGGDMTFKTTGNAPSAVTGQAHLSHRAQRASPQRSIPKATQSRAASSNMARAPVSGTPPRVPRRPAKAVRPYL